jgi:NTE family protein
MLGLAGATLDAMMRASTKSSINAADVHHQRAAQVLGSLDWRRSRELIEEGYKAAEAMRDQLLPLAVSEADYAAWKQARQSRRRTELPTPSFVSTEGFLEVDARRLECAARARMSACRWTSRLLQFALARCPASDRYETITWRIVSNEAGDRGLLIRGRPKPYAPPFLMLGNQPREHDVERLPHHPDRPLPSRSTHGRLGFRITGRWHSRI